MYQTSIRQFLDLLRLGIEPAQSALTATDATRLVDLARQQLVASWYWHRLRRVGLAGQLETPRQQELRGVGLAIATQGLCIESGISGVMQTLSEAGISSVLLKGAAYSALTVRYPYIAQRQTGDVDMLVEPGRADDAWQLLQGSGFRRVSDAPSIHHDHHHLPTLVSPTGFQLEIHTASTMFLSASDSWKLFGVPAEVVSWRGTNVRVPTATMLLWHSVVHSLGDGADGCRMRNLLTSAALMLQPIDWELFQLLLSDHPLCHHDSRRPIPLKGVKRWLSAAAWLARVELPQGLRAGNDSERMLHNLLLAQWQSIMGIRARPAHVSRMSRFGDEAALAAFGLGLHDGGHWQSPRQRRKHLVSSAILQTAYHLSIPLLQRRS